MDYIGPTLVVAGDLTCADDLTVVGRINGQVHVRGASLTIDPKAHVEASLRAARVYVYGTVKGTIQASERIELHPSATVSGDLSATHVVIADGARFNGRVDMAERTIAAKVAQYKASSAR